MSKIIQYFTTWYRETKIIDKRFLKFLKYYLTQATLGAVAMLLVLILVDSLADAALAAGLGASVAINLYTLQIRQGVTGH